MSPTPVLDLSGDPERLAAIVASPRRAGAAGAVLVSGVLPDGHRVYGWYARDAAGAGRAPAPGAAGELPARVPAPIAPVDAREAQIRAIAANLNRTPVRVGVPAPTGRPTAPASTGGMSPARRRELLGHTAHGGAIVDAERRA